MAKNTFIVEILEDGTVKVEAPGSFEPSVHAGAEKALNNIINDLGGNCTKTKIGHVHTHIDGHTHSHDHEEQ